MIEGDVEDCFGAIHHGLLMEQVRRRVTDKRVLALIRLFLAAGVMTQLGTVTATPSGTPQGAILSPLLANVALSVLDRHFENAWRALGVRSQRPGIVHEAARPTGSSAMPTYPDVRISRLMPSRLLCRVAARIACGCWGWL